MEEMFLKLLNMSITAAFVFAFVFILRLFSKRAPKWISYALWSLVLFRLICPVSLTSALSVFGRLGGTGPSVVSDSMIFLPSGTGLAVTPHINTDIYGMNESIGGGLSTPEAASDAVLSSADPTQTLLFVGMCVWLIGITCLFIYSAVSYIRLKRRVSEATRVEGNVFETDTITSPFVFGFLRPRIYLPVGLAEAGRDDVLRHERAHIRRGDHFVKLLAFIVLSVHWFNPFMWLAFVLMSRDMEMSCDERVLRTLEPGARAGYGETLAGLAIKRPLLAGSPLAFGESGTKSRVRNVLNYKKPAFWVRIVAVLAVAVTAVCLLTNPKTELSGEQYSYDTATITVKSSGTEYTGVEISMRAWDLDARPTILTVDWKNSSKDDVIYGDYYHIYKLENGTWRSCASEKEFGFNDIAYGLAPSSSAVKNYHNYVFDLSTTGTYKLETYFFFDKDIPITEDDHYNVWIEFEISEKSEDMTPSERTVTAVANDVNSIDTALEAAVIGFMENGWWYGGEKHPGTFKAAEFITLHEEETDGMRAYYGVSLYRSYLFTENSFTIAESFQCPCVITLDKATLVCTDFWVPGDGAYFEMDISENFPNWLVDDVALYTTNYLERQAAECDEKARVFGGFEETPPLLTVTSDSTTVLPYENHLWAQTYAENVNGWLSADAISVLADLGAVLEKLPTVTLREDFGMTYAADVTYSGVTVVAGESLEALYRNADKMVLTALPEGTYYVAVNVTKQGDYIEAGGDFESEGYECVYRFVVDAHSYDDMLMSRPIADRVCIDIRRTADGGIAGYLAPKDQEAWLAAFENAIAHAEEGGAWLDAEVSLGIWIVYQDDWWQFADSGALLGSGQRRVEAPDAEALFALTEPVIQRYYYSAYHPDKIDGVISATLELNGSTYTMTDADTLSRIENLLSTAAELRGGAGCPFGALLALEITGDSIVIALSTDDCATYMVNGVYFEYEGSDNAALYALFGVTLPKF